MDENHVITIENYINLLHRLTNYPEEVISEYINHFDENHVGDITLRDIYNDNTTMKLYWIEKRLKLQKIINLSK